jgi:hypothetical protein
MQASKNFDDSRGGFANSQARQWQWCGARIARRSKRWSIWNLPSEGENMKNDRGILAVAALVLLLVGYLMIAAVADGE